MRVDDVVLRERAGTVRVRQGRKEREVPLNASVLRGLSSTLAIRPLCIVRR